MVRACRQEAIVARPFVTSYLLSSFATNADYLRYFAHQALSGDSCDKVPAKPKTGSLRHSCASGPIAHLTDRHS